MSDVQRLRDGFYLLEPKDGTVGAERVTEHFGGDQRIEVVLSELGRPDRLSIEQFTRLSYVLEKVLDTRDACRLGFYLFDPAYEAKMTPESFHALLGHRGLSVPRRDVDDLFGRLGLRTLAYETYEPLYEQFFG